MLDGRYITDCEACHGPIIGKAYYTCGHAICEKCKRKLMGNDDKSKGENNNE